MIIDAAEECAEVDGASAPCCWKGELALLYISTYIHVYRNFSF